MLQTNISRLIFILSFACSSRKTSMCVNEFAEIAVKWYRRNKTKIDFYSQLFIVSTVEAESMSNVKPNSVRKFSELHKL